MHLAVTARRQPVSGTAAKPYGFAAATHRGGFWGMERRWPQRTALEEALGLSSDSLCPRGVLVIGSLGSSGQLGIRRYAGS